MKIDITIQGVQICNQMIYRILHITKTTKNGIKTEGSSGFMVRSCSHYLTVCPVIDHFNGNYNVMCPFYGPCANIFVIPEHVPFSGFVGKTRVIERTIWSPNNICISFKDGDLVTASNSSDNWRIKDKEFKDYLGTYGFTLQVHLGRCMNLVLLLSYLCQTTQNFKTVIVTFSGNIRGLFNKTITVVRANSSIQ